MARNFADLKGAIPSSDIKPAIKADETAFATEELDDATALSLVLTDANSAISYLQSKALLPAGVDTADDLIRAYMRPRQWSDGKPRANMPMYTVLEAIEKVLPTLYLSLFGTGKRRPFEVEPVGRTSPQAARAKAALLDWCIKQSELKEEMRLSLKTVLTYGFMVGWWGWENRVIRKRVYEKDENGKIKGSWKNLEVSIPTYDNLNLRSVLYDPRCARQDIQNKRSGADFVIKQVMINANVLDDMRKDTETYKNIPSRTALREILAQQDEPTEDTTTTNKRAVWREFQAQLDSEKSSLDPLLQPLEYLEYWTPHRVIGVLQRKIVIRNQENEFAEIPGLSCAFIDVLNSAWGFGIARLLSGEQRFQVGVANNWIDSLALTLNPTFQLLKGIGPGTQNINIAPGKVITEAGELKPLVVPDVSEAAMNALESSTQRGNKRVGAEGGENLPMQALRTGTGVQALTGDIVQRLQYFLEIFINLIYLPVLRKFLYLASEKLEPEQINSILMEQEGKAYEGDILDVFNAEIDVDVIAGADLMARQAAAQLIPLVVQTIASGPVAAQLEVQGKYFDFDEFLTEALTLQGWDMARLIVPMTPEMIKNVQAKNQALQTAQANLAMQTAKHQDDMELANEKGVVQAGVGIVREAAKSHLQQASAALEAMQPPNPVDNEMPQS